MKPHVYTSNAFQFPLLRHALGLGKQDSLRICIPDITTVFTYTGHWYQDHGSRLNSIMGLLWIGDNTNNKNDYFKSERSDTHGAKILINSMDRLLFTSINLRALENDHNFHIIKL